MNLIQCKLNELLMYHCGCYGNLVTIAVRYVADAYCPIDKIIPNMDLIRLNTKEVSK